MEDETVLYWSWSLVKRSLLFMPNFQAGQVEPGSSMLGVRKVVARGVSREREPERETKSGVLAVCRGKRLKPSKRRICGSGPFLLCLQSSSGGVVLFVLAG